MSTWDAAIKAIKEKVPSADEAALQATIAHADSEFASSIVDLILFGDGTTLHVSLDTAVGTGDCANLGNGAFKGQLTTPVSGTYLLTVTATTAKLYDDDGGLIYNGKGSASVGLRNSWPITF
ncbi:hypothetical protein MIND_00013900 [Mycena indigotica]|uniref:Uncharacterized protein n=1 Tax=Mycena indigotica TaxID=2126181 RepID=A0A8H6TAM5_9AGAR|nr:uncharacterized protein MIND_00013900 [Mycena indigotica]KAF7314998.1 hypothetical protein MIND_00013900 [Mycena indigotica]